MGKKITTASGNVRATPAHGVSTGGAGVVVVAAQKTATARFPVALKRYHLATVLKIAAAAAAAMLCISIAAIPIIIGYDTMSGFVASIRISACMAVCIKFLSNLYNSFNPRSYAAFYLQHISAGIFQKPKYRHKWVQNTRLVALVKEGLASAPDEEEMTLFSGLQQSGKTTAVLMECAAQERCGFFVDMGEYKQDLGCHEKLSRFVANSFIDNLHVYRSRWQHCLSLFLPRPKEDVVYDSVKDVFSHIISCTLVVDELQLLVNSNVKHAGILNTFCKLSALGTVVLISSEYNVPRHLEEMSHISSRTQVIFAPTASQHEMLPHVKDRFGPSRADSIVRLVDGSFFLLKQLDRFNHATDQLGSLENFFKAKLITALELTQHGLHDEGKATRTARALIAAAWLAAGKNINPRDPATLELAQVHGAKLETDIVTRKVTASFSTPLAQRVLHELVHDKSTWELLREKKLSPNINNAINNAVRLLNIAP